jgi:hypothetical protein
LTLVLECIQADYPTTCPCTAIDKQTQLLDVEVLALRAELPLEQSV